MGVNFLPFDIASYLIFLLRSHILPGNFSFRVRIESNGQKFVHNIKLQIDCVKSYEDEQRILYVLL